MNAIKKPSRCECRHLFFYLGTPLTSTPTVESRKKSVLPKFTPAITGFDHQVEVNIFFFFILLILVVA